MPLYLCRWTNGDCSVVQAPNKSAAIAALDEEGDAELCPITRIRNFMVHFTLADKGTLEFEDLGGVATDVILRAAYPLLAKALYSGRRKRKMFIREAVKKERERVLPRKPKEPQTELGKKIKAWTDAPTSLVDRIVREKADEALAAFRPKGKPN
jgi:hypothetical protein